MVFNIHRCPAAAPVSAGRLPETDKYPQMSGSSAVCSGILQPPDPPRRTSVHTQKQAQQPHGFKELDREDSS